MTTLKIYKTHPDVVLPKFGTGQAACFDISFQAFGEEITYTGFNKTNAPITRSTPDKKIVIMPGDRIMVPTGLIFDIPEGYSVRIHPRSGLSFKQGLILANLEAVIDSDYVQETFILLTNTTEIGQSIHVGDRIAQAELVQQIRYQIEETTDKPAQKTDRVGGIGSTGVKTDIDFQQMIQKMEEDAAKLTKNEEPVKRGRGRPPGSPNKPKNVVVQA